jgi:5-methyltetrahydropteroyltriglutamate--homocysteine methyltransferase
MLQTTLAGSLPKPLWLAEPEKLWAPWRLEGEALEAGKRDATILSVKLQEDAGLDIVGDGEQARVHFVHGFLANLDGIDFAKKTVMGIRNNRYEAEVPTVTGPIRRKGPVHAMEAVAARAHTTRRLKFTLPGPMTIVDTIADEHYGRREDLAMAFAAVLNEEAHELQRLGVDVIQFDEPAFNVYMKEVSDWGIACLERAAEGLTATTAVHICYGYGIKANIDWKATLGGEWRQYEETFPVIARSSIQQVSLECRNSRVPLELIKLLDGKDVLAGAIDVASNAIETPEEVAATIRAALAFVAPEKLFPCTNCGLAPMSGRRRLWQARGAGGRRRPGAPGTRPRGLSQRSAAMAGLIRFEHRRQKVIPIRRFALRLGRAMALYVALAVVGLVIGMAGYAGTEGMGLTDAFVNASMILSGMGPVDQLKTDGGKIFAGLYAIFSGLFVVIASGFVLAPVLHRVLHSFHVEEGKSDDD